MKLLFDENLSPRLVRLLAAEYPGSSHLELQDMRGATDAAVWQRAQDSGFAVVSKDNDFRQRSFLLGPPPKIVWLDVGNAGTATIAELLRQSVARVEAFCAAREESLLILGNESSRTR